MDDMPLPKYNPNCPHAFFRRTKNVELFLLSLGLRFVSIEFMLTISKDTLPQSCLSYLAFRVSFRETLERIRLARQIGEDSADCLGYLAEVSFLRGVPPHIQLDLLADTWCKHVSNETFEADLVDESVVYATCETAARVAEDEPEIFRDFLVGGPLESQIDPDHFLATELRSLHLNLSNEGDFLMISQFEDIPPDEAGPLKKEFGLDEKKLDVMFDVLSRWSMSEHFLNNLSGLLTKREIVRTALELGVR